MKAHREGLPLTGKQERLLLKLAIEASRTDHPNPERRDCPGGKSLEALAKRKLNGEALGAVVDHIAECSPCFLEYEQLRASIRTRKAAKLLAFAVVAVGLTLLLRSYFAGRQPTQSPNAPIVRTIPQVDQRQTPVALVVDLRFRGPARRPDNAAVGAMPRLPRALLQLQLKLPLGSEEGQYDVILYADGIAQSPIVRGRAEFRNRMEVLDITMDTRTFAPGRYELRLRRTGSVWQRFPILIE